MGQCLTSSTDENSKKMWPKLGPNRVEMMFSVLMSSGVQSNLHVFFKNVSLENILTFAKFC